MIIKKYARYRNKRTAYRSLRFSIIIVFLALLMQGSLHAQQSEEPPSGYMAGQPAGFLESQEPGLLFYLSGKSEFAADFAAGGQHLPNFLRDIRVIENGPFNRAIEADDSQLLSYWAPGNIYAQRGTLSFFWRSRYPAGPTEFPVFRVGYADHSSWDMVWLRIDFNGSGFDAFVTDVGLTRTRVSHFMDKVPGPDEWTHIALSWDETEGIRLYINGKLAEKSTVVGKIYDTGLDQFGPHSRIISPYQVQSAYNFQRGGDLAELRIYDRMLSDENIAELALGKIPSRIPLLHRDLSDRHWRDAWWTRHGWNLPNQPPPLLESANTLVRKVEIHDAIDIKRWYWKANDGIRETTWPGVYNMSRLPGRYDYFVFPDWDCYSMSGQTIRFHLPENMPWNHIEMWGKAWGQLTHESKHPYEHTFAVRSQQQVKSYHRTQEKKYGGIIRFDNALIEEPIGSFMVYQVEDGRSPDGRISETFTLIPAPRILNNQVLKEVAGFIHGRYPFDERAMMVGIPEMNTTPAGTGILQEHTHPLIHILLPYSNHSEAGLDGVEIELPALDVKPTHGEVFPLNLRIKDPLWQMRDLADFSFSVLPGRSYTLWFDTRDRILPQGRALYLTLAGAGADFNPELLEGARVRLIYKSKDDALAEHIKDRFTQVRDIHAHNVEEHPRSPRLNSYNRFYADLHDILKYDPDHWLTNAYWHWVSREPADRPDYKITKVPEGVPEWAHLQVEYLRHLERLAMYFIDERQISNGEFGGGLSDDGDLTNFFPGMALLGVQPEKILKSLRLHMTAYYDQKRNSYDASLKQRSLPLFTNGLATIFTDELHAYEDGIQVTGQLQLLDYGIPLYFNRGMETARRMLEDITRINPHGHRLFRSRYYSGTKIAEEDPWQWSVPYSYIVLHTAYLVARYNGNPELIQMITEIADALLAHKDAEGKLYSEINFETGEFRGEPGVQGTQTLFLVAYDLTGDEKYLEYIPDREDGKHEFNAARLAERYTEEIKTLGVREYIHTEGSLWIDRISTNYHIAAQEDRLGGVAMTRIRHLYPQHFVSWKFNKPASYESVAIFISEANPEKIDIIAYNLDQKTVHADMTTWDVKPGIWRVRKGLDTTGDLHIDTRLSENMINLTRGEVLKLSFEPREHTIINLELVEPAATGYWERPDLGIGRDDITINGNEVIVRVHSIGAVTSPATILELRDANGNLVSDAKVPAMEPPVDLVPRWTDVRLTVPEGTDLSRGSVVIDPKQETEQITRCNTEVRWGFSDAD